MTNTELTLDQLQTISGGGRVAKTKIGKWFEKKYGDGNGTHEGSDYVDEAINVGIKVVSTIVFGGITGVHQLPGEPGPRPGVEY